ncbi:pyruvate formate-lyase-activating protein [Thauera sinica]|uniref:Pyruvate formate-lyase-activating enzyme n=1 Tax=Thauera sinica TaxID=2665146 RepID=A0ABW1AQ10_9RHOO|nr:pyruvate formate-lyase-activating protein [Thauera sp. K11]
MPLTDMPVAPDRCPCAPLAAPQGAARAGVREGWVHSIETGAAADGPGIRYVVFLSGCPLRCLYCHNPDTWHQRNGRLAAADEILSDIARYRGFLRAGRGGVTISGGEPLAQPRFTAALLRGCKALGLHTAMDTSGVAGNKADDAMLADVDLVLLDIKAFSEARYRRLTGAPLAPTLAFAHRLAAVGKPVWLRYVLVPGLTDDRREIEALAGFAAGLGNVERVDVLPFHKLGEYKWADSGRPYRLADVSPPSRELVDEVCGLFRSHGLRTA